MNLNFHVKVICLFILLSFQNSIAQWKNKNVSNIKNDIIVTYDVIYENELTEKQKLAEALSYTVVARRRVCQPTPPGKPSTWFPGEGLVTQARMCHFLSNMSP